MEPFRVLIADDHPIFRHGVQAMLAAASDLTCVGEARTGQEAVDVAASLQPDVVLMDIVMPKKSGIEATSEIVKALPNVKVVACSTVDQNSMVMRALDAGCCNYVVKPFKAEDVLKAVRAASQLKSKEVGV